MNKVPVRHVFCEYSGFPCHSFLRQLHTHSSPGAGTVGQTVTDVPSGFSLTPPQEIKLVLLEKLIVGILDTFCEPSPQSSQQRTTHFLNIIPHLGLNPPSVLFLSDPLNSIFMLSSLSSSSTLRNFSLCFLPLSHHSHYMFRPYL
jgi:hypothetical protein